VIAALEKMRGTEGIAAPLPVKPPPEPAKPVAKPNDPAALPDYVPQNEAKKAFAAAEESVKKHADDDYAAALIWFKMANDYPGTDYAMKALNLARDAQARFASKLSEKKPEELPDTPEMAPVKKGDELAAKGDLEQAIEQYKNSLKQKSNILVHRKLGHAYFACAEKMKVDLIPKFEKLEPQYRKAYDGAWVWQYGLGGARMRVFNDNYAPWIEARRQYQALARQIQDAKNYYLYGQWEFERVVKLAPAGKDLDAAAHAALCLSARGDSQPRARDDLKRVIKDYVPADQTEMTVYEYCKTELARISR
jgi:tetratricopeptide (TPR) repeat protein